MGWRCGEVSGSCGLGIALSKNWGVCFLLRLARGSIRIIVVQCYFLGSPVCATLPPPQISCSGTFRFRSAVCHETLYNSALGLPTDPTLPHKAFTNTGMSTRQRQGAMIWYLLSASTIPCRTRQRMAVASNSKFSVTPKGFACMLMASALLLRSLNFKESGDVQESCLVS